MTLDAVVNNITNTLESFEAPALPLPPFLLKCTAMTRPGLSAYKIATNIIKEHEILKIPTGPNPDGSDNMINQFVYNIVKCFVDALQKDASIQAALPTQSLLIQATGANAGGPFTCTGTNLYDALMSGIIR